MLLKKGAFSANRRTPTPPMSLLEYDEMFPTDALCKPEVFQRLRLRTTNRPAIPLAEALTELLDVEQVKKPGWKHVPFLLAMREAQKLCQLVPALQQELLTRDHRMTLIHLLSEMLSQDVRFIHSYGEERFWKSREVGKFIEVLPWLPRNDDDQGGDTARDQGRTEDAHGDNTTNILLHLHNAEERTRQDLGRRSRNVRHTALAAARIHDQRADEQRRTNGLARRIWTRNETCALLFLLKRTTHVQDCTTIFTNSRVRYQLTKFFNRGLNLEVSTRYLYRFTRVDIRCRV